MRKTGKNNANTMVATWGISEPQIYTIPEGVLFAIVFDSIGGYYFSP